MIMLKWCVTLLLNNAPLLSNHCEKWHPLEKENYERGDHIVVEIADRRGIIARDVRNLSPREKDSESYERDHSSKKQLCRK